MDSMNKQREAWISKVIDSVKGSERAQPSPMILKNIEAKVLAQETKILPMNQTIFIAAATLLLLIFNISILYQNIPNSTSISADQATASNMSSTLISNYKIYEQ